MLCFSAGAVLGEGRRAGHDRHPGDDSEREEHSAAEVQLQTQRRGWPRPGVVGPRIGNYLSLTAITSLLSTSTSFLILT